MHSSFKGIKKLVTGVYWCFCNMWLMSPEFVEAN